MSNRPQNDTLPAKESRKESKPSSGMMDFLKLIGVFIGLIALAYLLITGLSALTGG